MHHISVNETIVHRVHMSVLLPALQLVSEPPKLAEYQSYIEYEMKEGDPARVQIIFERALGENCLVPDLWAKYTTYLVSVRTYRVYTHEDDRDFFIHIYY